MSRLLLLLSLIGAAIYALLIYTHDVLTDEKAEKTYAEQAQPNHPVQHLSSWGSYLPDRSISQNSQLATSQPSTPSPPRQIDEPSQNSERNADQVATSEKATSSESGDMEPKPVELAKVVLAAQTHSQASVSSATVRFYRPGTELQVVRREGIWFEVSDPVTQERGWVLAQYLSSIESPTPIQVVTESTTEPPTVISPKSNKRHRSAKHAVHSVGVATADPWNPRWARRADRRRGFGLFIFRPLPRFAQR
jgi:Bacterial SH3 domain